MSKRVRGRQAAGDRSHRPTTLLQRLGSVRLPTGRPQRIALAVAGLAVVAAAMALALWPDREARQREYLDATACLLTDEKGVTGEPAAPIWAAMQEASVSSRVKVQYLAVNGPQTPENARNHAAALAGGKCGAVVAVGPTQISAIVAAAPAFPDVRFLTVGGTATAANVTVLDGTTPDRLRTAVQQQVAALADS